MRKFIKAPKNNYRPVDDKPYGGGPGMVMRAEPILKAIDKVLTKKEKLEVIKQEVKSLCSKFPAKR